MKIFYLSFFSYLIIITAGCVNSGDKIKGLAYDPPGSTITTDKEITVQPKKTYYFKNSGLHVSNEFEGARLNDYYQLNDSSYTAVIEPENAPINNSAWYAFKFWADEEQNIILNLNYIDGSHRYAPKLSYDRIEWTAIDTTLIETNTSRTLASLKLSIGTDTLWFSAQELITSSDYEKWEDDLAELPFVSKIIIGKSSQNRVINELIISESTSNNYLVIISRQHPPEVTGFFALKSFVKTVTGETDIAIEFRKKFKTLVIPLVNPDGVDNGHWRHNFNGVDLNRDWVNFNQPEPQVVRNEVSSIVDEGGRINFFIDFHSTQKDVFYTHSLKSTIPENFSEEEKITAENNFSLVRKWLRNLQRRLPDYYVNITDTLSKTTSPTSARWIQREFNAPALTYETGDETDRELIKIVAANAAEELMNLLLNVEKKNQVPLQKQRDFE